MNPHSCSFVAAALLTLSAPLPIAVSAAPVDAPGSPAERDARLARLPRPWVRPIRRITFEEYDATLKYWARLHPAIFSFRERGRSHGGQPVYAVKITDSTVPDADKQAALVTALHGGPERSGTTTALHLIERLIGDSRFARETRRKQIVHVVPIANPHALFATDRFGNAQGIDLYDPPIQWWDLKRIALAAPDKTPELAAVLSLVDEVRPEVHLDLHGTGLQAFPQNKLGDRTMLEGQTMFEVSACSYSNCGVRPWDPRVTEAMVRAGQEAGYGSDRAEADAQRCFWNADHDALRNRLWIPPRPGRFRSLFYGYMRYHTMISTTEIGWEQSGVARVCGVLALGNAPWLDEKTPGYPVTRVRARAGRFVTAYGATATQRRESRVELWRKQVNFADGMLYPEFDGRSTYVCAVTPKGMSALDADPGAFVANLSRLPGIDAGALARFIALGPEHRLTARPGPSPKGAPIRHGIGFRLRLPYRAPELLDVALNGHALNPSATDGYDAWYADGYTQVQINVPPAKTEAADLYIVTCAYKPDERRAYGWTPPEAVLRELGGR